MALVAFRDKWDLEGATGSLALAVAGGSSKWQSTVTAEWNWGQQLVGHYEQLESVASWWQQRHRGAICSGSYAVAEALGSGALDTRLTVVMTGS